MIQGRQILSRLKEYSGEKSEFYSYENVKITRDALERGIMLYNKAIFKFLGNALINRLGKTQYQTDDEVRECLKPNSDLGLGQWIDVAGLISPAHMIEGLIEKIENKSIKNVDALHLEFQKLNKKYNDYEWTWTMDTLLKESGKKKQTMWSEDVIQLIKRWKKCVIDLDELLYADAQKEFTLSSQTGFGIDGDSNTRIMDFEQVRGEFERNPQVAAIKRHIKEKTALGDEILKRMRRVQDA